MVAAIGAAVAVATFAVGRLTAARDGGKQEGAREAMVGARLAEHERRMEQIEAEIGRARERIHDHGQQLHTSAIEFRVLVERFDGIDARIADIAQDVKTLLTHGAK